MKLLVTTDAHLIKDTNNQYWCQTIYGYQFWTRYLNVFEDVVIAARVKQADITDKYRRVDGEHVTVFEIPFYQGPKELIQKYYVITKTIKNVFDGCDAALFRMPSPTGQLVWNRRKSFDGPIGLEVVYDLSDDLKAAESTFVQKMTSRIQIHFLKRACIEANGVSYVTEHTIQKSFPSYASLFGESDDHFETSYSTITMSDDAFCGSRDFTGKHSFTLIMSDVAMNTYRKGEKTFLHVIKRLRDKGYDINGIIIGDGKKKYEFELLSEQLGLRNNVCFTGLLSDAEEVRAYLKKADVFVFPTSAEGLPRGILEAMAVGLPVVSAPIGGIPEILDMQFLYQQNDIDGYVQCIEKLILNPLLMNEVSEKNYEVSKRFSNNILTNRRNDFYLKLRKLVKRGKEQ